MPYPQAADAPAPTSSDDRAEDFAQFLDQLEEDDTLDEAPASPVPDDSDRMSTADDPAAAAPVSSGEDIRALFAALPPELQAKLDEQNAAHRTALQSATDARRDTAAQAHAAVAEQQRFYATELERIAAQHAPQRPDPALLAHNPQAFHHMQALYDAQIARHHALAQQASQAQAEAQQRDAITRQHELAQDQATLGEQLGEDWTDGARRHAMLSGLEEVGTALGYSMELMGQAGATDILALRSAAEWKAKADKYDALQAAKPNALRAARDAPRVARPGVTPTRAEQSARSREAAWQRAKTERSGDAYAAVLDSLGISL